MHYLQAGAKESIVPSVQILAIEVQFGARNCVKKVPGFLRSFPNLETLHVQVKLVDLTTLAALSELIIYLARSEL